MNGKDDPPGPDGGPGEFAAALDDVQPLGDRDKLARAQAPRVRRRPPRNRDREPDAFLYPDPDEPRLAHRASVAATTLDRLASGALAVERKLDLHGMRAEPARDALRRTIAACAKERTSVLLVIHGRGKHSGGFAVLREDLPEWLEAEDRVLAFAPARSGDAAGATGVLLRTGRGSR